MPRVSFVLVLLLAVSLSTMSHAQVSRGMQLVHADPASCSVVSAKSLCSPQRIRSTHPILRCPGK
eukprot:2806666-Rhodomonas_salina.2